MIFIKHQDLSPRLDTIVIDIQFRCKKTSWISAKRLNPHPLTISTMNFNQLSQNSIWIIWQTSSRTLLQLNKPRGLKTKREKNKIKILVFNPFKKKEIRKKIAKKLQSLVFNIQKKNLYNKKKKVLYSKSWILKLWESIFSKGKKRKDPNLSDLTFLKEPWTQFHLNLSYTPKIQPLWISNLEKFKICHSMASTTVNHFLKIMRSCLRGWRSSNHWLITSVTTMESGLNPLLKE